MANIDQVQLPDGSQYHIIDTTSGYATSAYVQQAVSSITKATIGLGNVDNTADLDKPISTATQTALDGKPDLDMIAPTETSTTATQRYEIGDHFILGGTLYTATAIIAVNDSIVVDTNCVASDSIEEQIEDANTAIAKCEVLPISFSSFSSLPQTKSDANIETDMVVVNSVLSNPSAQTGDWTVNTDTAGQVTVSGTISGSTTLTLYLMKSR